MTNNPYAAPGTMPESPRSTSGTPHYVGFWARLAASIVDNLLLVAVTWPLLLLIYGFSYLEQQSVIAGPADALISWVLPAVIIITLWRRIQSTPGKLIFRARVVDADTGQPASLGRYVLRYVGYFLSAIPLGLGFIWVAFDKRKQGWHDKMANTVVVQRG